MTAIGSNGGTTNVSRFKLYDIAGDRLVESRRYATFKTIDDIGAIRSGAVVEIPYRDIDADGFTVVDYIPAQGK